MKSEERAELYLHELVLMAVGWDRTGCFRMLRALAGGFYPKSAGVSQISNCGIS